MKNIAIGILLVLISIAGNTQEVYIYGEKGEKLYFQKSDSLVLIKFKENISSKEKILIINRINPEYKSSIKFSKQRKIVALDKNCRQNIEGLKKSESVICANQSLVSEDGTIHFSTDKILVKLKSGLQLENILSEKNVEFVKYHQIGYDKDSYLIYLKDGNSVATANYLYETGYFIYAQPSFTRLMQMQNALYDDQWGLNNTGQNGGTAGVDIDAEDAWDVTTGCINISIAVIDQGIDLDHPDLENNLLAGYDAPKIVDATGKVLFQSTKHETSPYVQEHKDLITCIRQNIPFNEAEATAISVMTAIMGRISAYTGKEVTFDEMMNSDIKLGPDTYIMGDIGFMANAKVPVPGTLERKK